MSPAHGTGLWRWLRFACIIDQPQGARLLIYTYYYLEYLLANSIFPYSKSGFFFLSPHPAMGASTGANLAKWTRRAIVLLFSCPYPCSSSRWSLKSGYILDIFHHMLLTFASMCIINLLLYQLNYQNVWSRIASRGEGPTNSNHGTTPGYCY